MLLFPALALSLTGALADYARGVEALGRGDAREAARRLCRAARGPVHSKAQARLYCARAEMAAGRVARARAEYERLARSPSAVRGRALWGAAEAAWQIGRRGEAGRRYREAIDLARGEGDAGLALWRAGERKRLAIQEPDHALAAQAGVALTPAEGVERARRLVERRRWEEAIAELDALDGSLRGGLAHEARYWAATARYRTRKRYDEAAAMLLGLHAELPPAMRADALFHGARALSRADRDDEAIARYEEVVRRYPGAREAEEAAFLAGWLEHHHERFERAVERLDDALRRYPRGRFAEEARWFRAWSLYLLGRNEEATAALGALEDREDGPLDPGQALYWKGRALARLEREDEARAAWRETARRFPLTWYGLLARQRLGAAEPLLDDAPVALQRDGKADAEPLFAVADELIEVGLPDEASRELREGERALFGRHGRAALAPLLDRARRAGDWNLAMRLAVVHGGEALSREPLGDARTVWEAAYPRAYRALVDRYAPTGGNPELYLFAVMRKESAFQPDLVSYADARGLLQMIPRTSVRVAEAIGIEYGERTLYDPEMNLRLGAWYIGRLLGKFRGQVPLGGAAYNAGPRAVMRWCERRRGIQTDEFVERIPYSQTRRYARRLTAIYARYLYLYQGAIYRVADALDCDYTKDDGIDY